MWIRFSIPREDEARLQHLVDRFGGGNRSAFLRVAMQRMEIIERADRLEDLAEYGAERLAEKDLSVGQIPDLVKETLRVRAPGESAAN